MYPDTKLLQTVRNILINYRLNKLIIDNLNTNYVKSVNIYEREIHLTHLTCNEFWVL